MKHYPRAEKFFQLPLALLTTAGPKSGEPDQRFTHALCKENSEAHTGNMQTGPSSLAVSRGRGGAQRSKGRLSDRAGAPPLRELGVQAVAEDLDVLKQGLVKKADSPAEPSLQPRW